MKKIVLGLAAVAIIATGYGFWPDRSGAQLSDTAPASGMPLVEVSVTTITLKTVNLTKDLPGRISPYRIAEIRPQVNGIVTKRLFEEGAEVQEGQQLYQIDPATYQAAYDSAQADYMKAEASLKAATAKFNRHEELVKVGAVSKQTFEDVKAALDQARADVAIAKASRARAKINLDYTKVFSPISGRIGKSLVTEGALVTANQAASLASVQQFDSVYVDVTQSSTELMALRRHVDGQDKTPVLLLLEGDSHVYDHMGELQFSDITVDQTTGSVQLRILFPNPERELLPGLFVRARIEQARQEGAILVPQKSVARGPDGGVTVWVVSADDKVSLRPIKVSQPIDDQWFVTEGLNAGDRVIVEGVQKVADGASVKPVDANQPSTSSEILAAPAEAEELEIAPVAGDDVQAPAEDAPIQSETAQ